MLHLQVRIVEEDAVKWFSFMCSRMLTAQDFSHYHQSLQGLVHADKSNPCDPRLLYFVDMVGTIVAGNSANDHSAGSLVLQDEESRLVSCVNLFFSGYAGMLVCRSLDLDHLEK